MQGDGGRLAHSKRSVWGGAALGKQSSCMSGANAQVSFAFGIVHAQLVHDAGLVVGT